MDFKKHFLDTYDLENFLSIVHASQEISNLDDFKEWTRRELQLLLPHATLCFSFGESMRQPLRLRESPNFAGMSVSIEQSFFKLIEPLAKKWSKSLLPQFFETGTFSESLKGSYRECSLSNILLHGQHNIESTRFAYFAFCDIPEKLTVRHACLAELLVPQLCSILSRVTSQKNFMGANRALASLLTGRERETLHYIMMGKTNWEIGKLLGISSETVKTHTKHIFDKLKVCKRSQAVAKLHELDGL